MRGKGGAALCLSGVVLACLLSPGAAHAAFPGQNGKIAFTQGADIQRGYIYTINPDGSARQELTTTGFDHNPAWSPNGRKIAFSSERDGNAEIYVMNADGSDQRRITNDPAGRDRHPTWSPDGQRIAYERYEPGAGFDIYVINADGTGGANITSGPAHGTEPAWSPDGRLIAFIRDNNVQVMSPDGGGRTELTHYPPATRDLHLNPFLPNWSPDGRLIAYQFIAGGGPQFFYMVEVIRPDGTREGTVFLLGYNGEPAWSPDGREMVVDLGQGLNRVDISAWDRVHVPPFAAIPNSANRDHEPDWQPLVPEPQRGDFKNAAKFCDALRSFLGAADFASRYRNRGACVSRS